MGVGSVGDRARPGRDRRGHVSNVRAAVKLTKREARLLAAFAPGLLRATKIRRYVDRLAVEAYGSKSAADADAGRAAGMARRSPTTSRRAPRPRRAT